jgi:beta-glucosidase
MCIRDRCKDPERRICGKASDSLHRWKEDIRVMKEMGLNSYRFSIEWARIFPQKGTVSEEGLEYYRNLIHELKKNEIEPIVTCWHWTIPIWVDEDDGGFLNKKTDICFREYMKVLAENFAKDVKYWIVLNEPESVASKSYLLGDWPPCKRNPLSAAYFYYFRMVEWHKIGYEEIKKVNPDALVGVAKPNVYIEPYNQHIWNVGIAKFGHFLFSQLYLRRIRKYLDYIGLNYYFHLKIGIRGVKNDNDIVSDLGWWMKPFSIYYLLMDLKKYNLPIMITEDGVADSKDQYRKWWLDETFEAMRKALREGVNLIGYMHWSLIDNFEWADGFWPKFGLVEIEKGTLNRKIRESGYYYRDLIKAERGK